MTDPMSPMGMDDLFAEDLPEEGSSYQDLVQETFLQAFRKWDQFEGRSAPSSWLYTIAARICQRRNRLRSGEPAKVESLSELLPSGQPRVATIPSFDDSQLDEQLRREAQERVDRALAKLEEVLLAHDAVEEVSVIGRPDDEWGERVVAAVVLAADALLPVGELEDFARKVMKPLLEQPVAG